MKNLIKKIFIFIIISSTFVGNSFSNEKDLVFIGESDRAKYFIDRESVIKADIGKYIEFKLITSLKKPEKLNDNRNYFSVRTTSLADCKNKIVRDILTEFYDRKADDGDVTKAKLLKTDKGPDDMWFDAKTPGKVNTAIVERACSIHVVNSIDMEQLEALEKLMKDQKN